MKIVNVVATVKLASPLDLQMIHSQIHNTEFSKQGHWLKMRLPTDNSYIAFYKPGKFLIIQKDPKRIEKIAHIVLTMLKDIGIKGKILKTEIHNIIGLSSLVLEKPLEVLIVNLDSKKASYEPEQFPGLIYKDWGMNFLLFSSGKIIVSGAKSVKEAEDGLTNFNNLILS
jgi:transcription initiation factor TFIID TATA-box-binding protein